MIAYTSNTKGNIESNSRGEFERDRCDDGCVFKVGTFFFWFLGEVRIGGRVEAALHSGNEIRSRKGEKVLPKVSMQLHSLHTRMGAAQLVRDNFGRSSWTSSPGAFRSIRLWLERYGK
jgi:hypothetical protein